MGLQSLVARTLKRVYYKPGQSYRIPFGLNKGSKICFHESTIVSLMLGFHEPNTLAVMQSTIEPGDHVIDAGANCGYFCTFLSKCVGPKGTVHSFEPQRETFGVLSQTAAANQLTNVRLNQAAVTDKDGEVEFFEAANGLVSSLNQKWAGESTSVRVPGVALDSYVANQFKNGERIALIKMDIEGGAVFGLPGAEKIIREMKPVLILESHTPEEDLAIGRALQLAPYDVYRLGSTVPVTHLDRDHTDPGGIYATVVGIPKDRSYPRFHRSLAEVKRFGQR